MKIGVGFEVVCIKACRMKDSHKVVTTFGKVYEVIETYIPGSTYKKYSCFVITDDVGDRHYFPMNGKWFVTLKEYRRLKLERVEVVSNS